MLMNSSSQLWGATLALHSQDGQSEELRIGDLVAELLHTRVCKRC